MQDFDFDEYHVEYLGDLEENRDTNSLGCRVRQLLGWY
jgi:hypothetical protein